MVLALLESVPMNLPRKRRIAVLTALAILLFAGSALAVCTSHSKDSDHDGLPNCIEKRLGTNPHSADTDPGGLSSGPELVLGTATKVEVDGGEDGDAVRCCLPGSGVHDDCDQQSASDCSDAGGLNMGHGSCEPNPCP